MRGSGWRVPGYTVEQLLGRGGSSEVWRGRVGRSGDEVALKRVPLTDRAAWQHVRTEAAVLTTLDHPNVVRLHEVVPTRDAVVLVLDLAAGGSLAELLAARGRLSVGEVITAVAPVAAALAHAHAAGVLHGDVSAANILFTAGGLPLLADLGVARLLGDLRPVLSTPAYVDPVVAAGAPPTPPSDVFMLGGVVLHALTGSPTWPATDTETSLAAARLGRTDAAERLAAAAVPDATAAVVRRALDPDPARRGTAAEFALDLRASGRPAPLALAAGRPRAVLQPGPPGRARHAARPDASQLAADELVARHGAVGPLLGGRSGRLGGPSEPTLVDRLAGWRGRDGGPDGTGSPLPPLPPHADVAAPSDAATAPAAPPPRRAASAAQPLADLAPTRLVAPRPRPVLPRPPVRGRRRIGAGISVAIAVGAVVAALLLPLSGGADARPERRGPTAPAGSTSAPHATRTGTRGAISAPVVPTPLAAPSRPAPTDWLGALRRLDDVRARAFATGDAHLLDAVYGTAALTAQDARLLRSLVPAGCRLDGVHTSFTDVAVRPSSADTALVTATASIPATTLTCPAASGGTTRRAAASGGTTRRAVPAVASTRLAITLRRTATGVRITAETAVR